MSPPFGWKLAPECDWDYDKAREKWLKKIVVDHAEQETIRLARTMNRRGVKLSEIAKELTRRGRMPRGKAWHPNTVKRILEKKE